MRLSPEVENPRLVITVFGNPHPASRVPAEGHGLGDHRLGGEDIDLEALLDLHLFQRFEGRKGERLAALLLGEPPQHRGVAMT